MTRVLPLVFVSLCNPFQHLFLFNTEQYNFKSESTKTVYYIMRLISISVNLIYLHRWVNSKVMINKWTQVYDPKIAHYKYLNQLEFLVWYLEFQCLETPFLPSLYIFKCCTFVYHLVNKYLLSTSIINIKPSLWESKISTTTKLTI